MSFHEPRKNPGSALEILLNKGRDIIQDTGIEPYALTDFSSVPLDLFLEAQKIRTEVPAREKLTDLLEKRTGDIPEISDVTRFFESLQKEKLKKVRGKFALKLKDVLGPNPDPEKINTLFKIWETAVAGSGLIESLGINNEDKPNFFTEAKTQAVTLPAPQLTKEQDAALLTASDIIDRLLLPAVDSIQTLKRLKRHLFTTTLGPGAPEYVNRLIRARAGKLDNTAEDKTTTTPIKETDPGSKAITTTTPSGISYTLEF